MKTYFLVENGEQTGPFTLDELKKKKVQAEDLVWSEGWKDWKPAGKVATLKSLFATTPPPVPKQEKATPPPPPEKRAPKKASAKTPDPRLQPKNPPPKKKHPVLTFFRIIFGLFFVLLGIGTTLAAIDEYPVNPLMYGLAAFFILIGILLLFKGRKKRKQARQLAREQQRSFEARIQRVEPSPITTEQKKKDRSWLPWIIGFGVVVAAIAYHLITYEPEDIDEILKGLEGSTEQTSRQSTKESSAIDKSTKKVDPTSYPLHPLQMEKEISLFIGKARNDMVEARRSYAHPDCEWRFDQLTTKYGAKPIKLFFNGVVPVINYQSPVSSLVFFYNPWNDLVLITEWQKFEDLLFITDMELVSAGFLEFNGSSVEIVEPLWINREGVLPVEAIQEEVMVRTKLFNAIWEDQLGPDNWREAINALYEPAYVIREQSQVALRLKVQYTTLMDLVENPSMEMLYTPVVADLQSLQSGKEGLTSLLASGESTPDETSKILDQIPAEIWNKASIQSIRKVYDGAFVFIASPQLTTSFLSFYYQFRSDGSMYLKRIDFCPFENQ